MDMNELSVDDLEDGWDEDEDPIPLVFLKLNDQDLEIIDAH